MFIRHYVLINESLGLAGQQPLTVNSMTTWGRFARKKIRVKEFIGLSIDDLKKGFVDNAGYSDSQKFCRNETEV